MEQLLSLQCWAGSGGCTDGMSVSKNDLLTGNVLSTVVRALRTHAQLLSRVQLFAHLTDTRQLSRATPARSSA